ncbi:MAG: hypothetical protein M0P47_10100 [Bacteroidales bacterium]|nr:hypothetical protein [Bacteroidales bacterium]
MKSKLFVILFPCLVFIFSSCAKVADPEPVSTDNRTVFLGHWSVNESWTRFTYDVTITADPNSSDGVFIANFANTGSTSVPAGASISGKKIILDPNQVIGEGLTINGSGIYSASGPVINWNYTIFDGADLITASATYTR